MKIKSEKVFVRLTKDKTVVTADGKKTIIKVPAGPNATVILTENELNLLIGSIIESI